MDYDRPAVSELLQGITSNKVPLRQSLVDYLRDQDRASERSARRVLRIGRRLIETLIRP